MGKSAELRRFRRWLRDRVERGVGHPEASESVYRQAKGRRSLLDFIHQVEPKRRVTGRAKP